MRRRSLNVMLKDEKASLDSQSQGGTMPPEPEKVVVVVKKRGRPFSKNKKAEV